MSITLAKGSNRNQLTLMYGAYALPVSTPGLIHTNLMYVGNSSAIGNIHYAMDRGAEPDANDVKTLGRMFLLFHLLRDEFLQPYKGEVQPNYISVVRTRLNNEIKSLGISGVKIVEDGFMCFRYEDRMYTIDQPIQIYLNDYGVMWGYGACTNRDTILFGAGDRVVARTIPVSRLCPFVENHRERNK